VPPSEFAAKYREPELQPISHRGQYGPTGVERIRNDPQRGRTASLRFSDE